MPPAHPRDGRRRRPEHLRPDPAQRPVPPRQFRAGYAEVAKYGLLGDLQFFDWLDANGAAVGSDTLIDAGAANGYSIAVAVLADDGWVLNHGITSTDARDGETSYGAGRFIDRYVFPDGELLDVADVVTGMEGVGLEVRDADKPGFWERNGYHMYGDPFTEQRHWGD